VKLCWELVPVYASTRVGLVLTGSSISCLLSFSIQNGLLGTKFNWAVPSAFSGVGPWHALQLWASSHHIHYYSFYLSESRCLLIYRGLNLLLLLWSVIRGSNISKVFKSCNLCINLILLMDTACASSFPLGLVGKFIWCELDSDYMLIDFLSQRCTIADWMRRFQAAMQLRRRHLTHLFAS